MRFTLSLAAALALVSQAHAQQAPYNSSAVSGIGARNIGSATMSGRISALAAHPEPSGKITIFVGSASGGVWKSEDSGTTFRPVFDEQPVQSIGAVTLDPKEPKNVWVGTGESWTRNSVSIGNGVYRSMDGGETWSRLGLPNSERIAKIVVSPVNGETAYVAVPGALWSDSEERGLYKTTD
ncbi:MAG TPA: sialidase, partial [Thermoanaerobaculia bacterium]